MRQLISFWRALPERSKDSICLLLLVLFCLILFSKTVFFGQQISRVSELANLDVIFRWASDLKIKYDRDCFFMKVSAYMLVADIWRQGMVPLWNPYVGCGAPLLAELQSIVVSPWMLFYTLWPSLKTHNYLLVAQEVLGTVGMYLAARSLGLSRYGAIFAALVHLCCPHQQWRQELQMNHSFYPITVWAFIRLYQTKHFLWALAAGVGCAAQIVSGDAQVSLLSITVVSVLFVCMNIFGEGRQEPVLKRLSGAGIWLTAVGVNAFCLSAPVFLGFVEYVRLGDLSKNRPYYQVGNPAPWQSLAYSLVHTGYGGASLFAGCLCLPLISMSLLAVMKRRPYCLSVLVTAVFAFMNASRTVFFPYFDQAAGLMGLSRFEGMEVYLVQIAFLMAFGLEELVNASFSFKSRTFVMLVVSCIVTAAAPFILAKFGFDPSKYSFDSHVESYGFQPKQWTFDLVFLTVFLLVAVCRNKLKNAAFLILIVMPICLNTGSQAIALKHALPNLPKFQFPKLELLEMLAEKKERVLPVGYSLLFPNSNIVYKINSLAFKGPLSPPRLHRFIRTAGGHSDGFRRVFPNGPFSPLLDAASVRYFISYMPVRSEEEPFTDEHDIASAVAFKGNKQVKVTAAKVLYDSCKGELGGYVDWFVKDGEGENYSFQIVIYDGSGKLLHTGGPYYVRQREYLKKDTRPREFSRTSMDALIPMHVPESSEFHVGIKVSNIPKAQMLEPETSATAFDKTLIELATFTKRTKPLAPGRRFKMIKEYAGNFIRVYENVHALPAASVIHKTIVTADEKDSLQEIKKSSFDSHTVAIVEDKGLKALNGSASASENDEVSLSRPDVNSLSIDVKTESPGVLVVTEQYFPGWHALVDGKEVPILRANLMFRGIALEPGAHKIFMYYRPTYLTVSLVLLLGCLIVNAAAWLFHGRRAAQKEAA